MITNYLVQFEIFAEMSDACVAQWSDQSSGNRKTWARIPAQSKVSFFPQKDIQIF